MGDPASVKLLLFCVMLVRLWSGPGMNLLGSHSSLPTPAVSRVAGRRQFSFDHTINWPFPLVCCPLSCPHLWLVFACDCLSPTLRWVLHQARTRFCFRLSVLTQAWHSAVNAGTDAPTSWGRWGEEGESMGWILYFFHGLGSIFNLSSTSLVF